MKLPDPAANPLLTADQEIGLARCIEAGVFAQYLLANTCPSWATAAELRAVQAEGEAAWQQFYTANLRLAALVAHRWARRYQAEADDVLQECCLALGGAIRAWDWQRGTRFSTLAWRRLTVAARRACLQNLGGGQSPVWWLHTQAKLSRLAHDQLAQGCPAPAQRLAEELGRPTAWVHQALAWSPPRRLTEADEAIMAPSSSITPADAIWAHLCRLDPLGRRIVEARFGFRTGAPLTYQAIGRSLGLKPRAVKALESQALAQLMARLGVPLAVDDQAVDGQTDGFDTSYDAMTSALPLAA